MFIKLRRKKNRCDQLDRHGNVIQLQNLPKKNIEIIQIYYLEKTHISPEFHINLKNLDQS